MRRSALERFMEKVEKLPNGCWKWTAFKNSKGYGRFMDQGKAQFAHRWIYQHSVRPLLDLHIDHICRNRDCVNPAHLEPVTNAENARRDWHAQKMQCKYGHSLTPDNIYTNPGRRNRACKICRHAAMQRYRERQKP